MALGLLTVLLLFFPFFHFALRFHSILSHLLSAYNPIKDSLVHCGVGGCQPRWCCHLIRMLPGTPNLRRVLGMSNWEGGPAAGPGLARKNTHPVWPGGASGSHRRSCAGEGVV